MISNFAESTEIPRNTSLSEVLAFSLGSKEDGLDILTVEELRGYEPATRLGNPSNFNKGVTILRGAIVPLIDAYLAESGRTYLPSVQFRHHSYRFRTEHLHSC